MEEYIAVMLTILVATQAIRLIQIGISLHQQNKELKDLTDIAETDIWIKKENERMTYAKLKMEMRYIKEWQDEYERMKDVYSRSDAK